MDKFLLVYSVYSVKNGGEITERQKRVLFNNANHYLSNWIFKFLKFFNGLLEYKGNYEFKIMF